MNFGKVLWYHYNTIDDDPVREEHDIYLSKELADQLYWEVIYIHMYRYLLQFPLRPKGRVYPEPITVHVLYYLWKIGQF